MAVAAAGAAFDRFAPQQEATTNSASSTSLTQSPASSSSSTTRVEPLNSNSDDSGLPKTVLETERARSQIPRTHFLAPYPRIPPASYSSPSANAGYNIDLAGVPSSAQLSQLARHGSLALSPRTRTRTRAVNVDEGGRRLDSGP
ncbi:hypothetical protein VKT23_019126 [Stygiomarasmius scandens]|uniref:Uncharacterized protein n=1 Tax=Marasmiellus scandens TaxID=2682957 RepID=A0ABR1IM47_9AGAR